MRIGMIGLGKMGGNMARRLLRKGGEVIADGEQGCEVDAVGKFGFGTLILYSISLSVRARLSSQQSVCLQIGEAAP